MTGPQTLPGEVMGLSVAARQTILSCDIKATIGQGTLDACVPVIKSVNLAMLEHYIPHIVTSHKFTTPAGDVILLPHDMNLVTERGISYVVTNMQRELDKGSYATSHFTKDKEDRSTCMIHPCRNPVTMIHPCRNPVTMIHGLNTLRAFGLSRDAEFLAMLNGPIMTSLERRAIEWNRNLSALGRFLHTMRRELLVDQDRRLLVPAWAVYGERLRAASPS